MKAWAHFGPSRPATLVERPTVRRFAKAEKLGVIQWALTTLWGFLVLAIVLARLGAAPLFDVDEGAFAEATREMVAKGDYGVTTLDGAPRYDKPILTYWLQAASVRVFGLSEWALRFPSALAAWLWAIVIAQFAREQWSTRRGLVAGTMLVTSVGPLVIGRACTADALLNLLLALTLVDAWRHIESHRDAPLLRAYLWIALGLLTKGPIALIIPAAASLLYFISTRLLARWFRLAFDPRGWTILALVAGPWYAYALHRDGMAFVEGFLVRHNLARYLTPLEHHGGSLFYYVLMVPLLLLPWSASLPGVIHSLGRLWNTPRDRFLLLWAGLVVAFFSLSGTKLPHYGLYGATPAVLLLSRAVEQGEVRATRWTGCTIAGMLLLLAVGPALLPLLAGRISDPLYSALLGDPGDSWALQVAASTSLAAFLIAWVARGLSVNTVTAGAVALALVVGPFGVPWLGSALQSPIRRAALVARSSGLPAVQWKVRVPSFSLYRGSATPKARPVPGQLAITTVAAIDSIDQPAHIVFRERGYVLVYVEEIEEASNSPPSGQMERTSR